MKMVIKKLAFKNIADANPIRTTGVNIEKLFKQIARVAFTIHVIGNIKIDVLNTSCIPSVGQANPDIKHMDTNTKFDKPPNVIKLSENIPIAIP